jgi:DNA-binding winged helix-turn-helix (wHTH) protein
MILDIDARTLTEDNKTARLTERETALLAKLIRSYPRKVRWAAMISEVWSGEDEPDCSHGTIQVHAWHARKVIAEAGISRLIETHFGLGYFVNRPGQMLESRPSATIAADLLNEIADLLSSHRDPRAAKVLCRLPVVA